MKEDKIGSGRFKGRVAVIAGGARGIGRAVALRLLGEGATVICLDVLDEALQELSSTAQELETDKLQTVHLDISKEKDVQRELEGINRRFGRLDILINSAGIIGETSLPIVDTDSTIFESVLKVNLFGAYLLTKHVLPHMLAQEYGRILHISSIGGKEGNPGMVGYAASKSGMMGLVKAVGKEYATSGITVNGLAPAVIATPMNEDTSPEMLAYMRAKIPMGRLGTMTEAAALIAWIVSEEASFNTGFIFDLSGGRATF